MVIAKCLACNKEFVFGLWDFLDLSCECGSTNLEGYVDNKLVLHKSSELCKRCGSKALPLNWIELKKKKLCVDCIEKVPVQAMKGSKDRAELGYYPRNCPNGHPTALALSIHGERYVKCSKYPDCRWTANIDE